ncbi:MAG: altronate dehydratase [Cyclobacteriaceae bacterium]|nr:altronate dehydratase [Cyclobacteriaceae bacterium]
MADKPFIQLNSRDNVLIALENLEPGRRITFKGMDFGLKNHVPAKHKFTIAELQTGDPVIMYGILVGKALEKIPRGSLITVGNTTHAEEEYSVEPRRFKWEAPDISRWTPSTFLGYYRPDGRVGTANYWLVIPLTFCENRNVDVLKAALTESLGYSGEKDFLVDIRPLIQKFKAGHGMDDILQTDILHDRREISGNRIFRNVDGIKFLNHEGGCGGTREDSGLLCSLLAGYITHPNVGGATVLSLGCQHAQIRLIQDEIKKIDPSFGKPLVILEQQAYHSEKVFLTDAIKRTFTGLMEADKSIRKPAPISKLSIGLECGGSDGFSGISANPTIGYVADLIVALGGIAILSEFPELNGVEQELLNRCVSRDLAEKFASLMKQYSDRAIAIGSGFDNNPSPGNIRDGLITHTMKSAGAARKGGTSPITDVLDYTERASIPGLNLLCTPGNDVESTTGLAASGASIILFSTGLGTPTGNPVCPVVKVSSSTSLFERMNDIIDFDTGSIITGNETIRSLGEKMLDYVIEVASGVKTPAAVRSGQDDFIPWKRGISL